MRKADFRKLALFVALTMALGMLSGLSFAAIAEEESEPVRITCFAPNPSWGPINNDIWMMQEIGSRTNTQLDFIITPSSNSLEKFNLMLAGGDLPDLVLYTSTYIVKNKEFFKPLNELIESDCPNYAQLLEENPTLRKILTQTDGNIYTFPYVLADQFNYCFYVRQDWLDTLGLDAPVTLNDWYDMLVAFRDDDPNGNGEADEIPLIVESRRYNQGCEAELSMFTAAWGIEEEFYTLDGETVEFGAIDPRMKEALAWYNKLYSEKLLDQEYFVEDADTYEAKFNNDRVGAWTSYGSSADAESDYAETVPHMKITPVVPPIGPAGKSMTWQSNLPYKTNNAAITTSASDEATEAIMRIFNYMYSEEGILLTNFGEEGTTYELNADGAYVYTEEIMNDPDESPLGKLRKFGIGSWWPTIETDEFLNQLYGPNYQKAKEIYEAPGIIQFNLGGLTFTDEENEAIAAKYTEIKTLIDESLDLFITGDKPLDEFDEMVNKVKAMGIDELIQIYNDALARWNAA